MEIILELRQEVIFSLISPQHDMQLQILFAPQLLPKHNEAVKFRPTFHTNVTIHFLLNKTMKNHILR